MSPRNFTQRRRRLGRHARPWGPVRYGLSAVIYGTVIVAVIILAAAR